MQNGRERCTGSWGTSCPPLTFQNSASHSRARFEYPSGADRCSLQWYVDKAASTGLSVPPVDGASSTKRGSTASHCTKLLAPRISFTDDTIERRVSDSGPPTRESSKEHSTRSGRLSTSSIGGSQPLTRLARLLNQRPSFVPSDEIPRRLSWERYVNETDRRILKTTRGEGGGGKEPPPSIRGQGNRSKREKNVT
ncbi:uncharacterized protein LOC100867205 [Apis florea]|uniref:uncharacterized protein LOC100867205 n=1 Tax=Apis florea TaxID=7463 RepID=UPI0012FF5714|nr:uncharacterized protein LOC100867205 [Apis florea]